MLFIVCFTCAHLHTQHCFACLYTIKAESLRLNEHPRGERIILNAGGEQVWHTAGQQPARLCAVLSCCISTPQRHSHYHKTHTRGSQVDTEIRYTVHNPLATHVTICQGWQSGCNIWSCCGCRLGYRKDILQYTVGHVSMAGRRRSFAQVDQRSHRMPLFLELPANNHLRACAHRAEHVLQYIEQPCPTRYQSQKFLEGLASVF